MDDTQPPGDRGRPTVPARALRKVPPPQTQVARRKPGSREGRQGRRHDTAAAKDDARRAGRRGRWRRMRRGPGVDPDGETATPHRSKSKSAPSGARSDAQSNAVGTEGGLRRSPGLRNGRSPARLPSATGASWSGFDQVAGQTHLQDRALEVNASATSSSSSLTQAYPVPRGKGGITAAWRRPTQQCRQAPGSDRARAGDRDRSPRRS